MREIVVISGKGGTGKTSLTAAFAHLAKGAVICDLDVDAPDLHLILNPALEHDEEFVSGREAVIQPELCVGCGECERRCRFGAVHSQGGVYAVDPRRCEGCKVCVAFCPSGAIAFPEKACGRWFVSQTRFGVMAHARLHPGEENSGRLVSLLKQKAREIARRDGSEIILCDGAPGIGCPVISSLSGAHLAAVVTEPTPSGVHDLERVLGLCDHFRIPTCVVVNKCDLNPDAARSIVDLCRQRGSAVTAQLPHDEIVFEAMLQAKAVTEMLANPFAERVRAAWERIVALSETVQSSPAKAIHL